MRIEMMGFGMQWHWLDHMQTICTSLQTDNHTNTLLLSFYSLTGRMLFLKPTNSVQAPKAYSVSEVT